MGSEMCIRDSCNSDPNIPGIVSISIDAVVYPLPGDVNSTAVITPVNSPSSATVILHRPPSPSPAIGTL